MRHRMSNAIMFIAACAISTWASAQNAYRCGNTYSQTPCANGKTIDVTDSRSADQKKQTDAATASTAKAGDTMEKARLAQEKRDLAANKARPAVIAPTAVPAPAPPPQPVTYAKKKKKKPSPYFTAQAPREKKERKPAKAKKAASGQP